MEIFIRYMETYYKNMATCYLNGANMLSKWGKTIAGETVYQRVRPSLLIYY